MNAISGSILVVLLVVVCFAPRRWALLAMMAGVFFLTQGHSIDVAGLNIYPLRFIETVAFARVLFRRELNWSQLNRIDWTLLLLYNYAAVVWTLRSEVVTAQQPASAVDATMCYLALRAFIWSLEDFRWFLNAFVILLVPFTALVFAERLTGQSSFAIVGITEALYVRNGVTRCMGSFRHASLLGSVAASFLSLYVGLWLAGTRGFAALVGAVLCLILVVLTNSGGPMTSAMMVFVGWSVWPLRRRMFLVRWVVLAVLLILAIFMKAPIWYLTFKISALVGGGGFHRGLLMDRAWENLDQWWLIGMDIAKTIDWFPYMHSLVGGADVTNQFVVFGLRAGLAAIALTVAVLVFAFKRLGTGLADARFSGERPRASEFLLWGLGVTLLVHVVSWLGISYFDQSWVVWLMHLAAVSGAVQGAGVPRPPTHCVDESSRWVVVGQC
jgi:hypothetical protein